MQWPHASQGCKYAATAPPCSATAAGAAARLKRQGTRTSPPTV
jgi:hypothetical protein